MLITFSGLDGAGKTTLIAWLRNELEGQRRRVAVLHLNDDVGVYAALRALRDRLRGGPPAPPDAPPRMTPLPTRLGRLRDAVLWSKSLRRVLYPLDVAWFLLVRFWVEVVQRRVLIMDRYFYDRLVDVAETGGAQRGWRWLRALARVTPTPDLPVLLDLTPEEAFARKGEYTVPYLRRRWTAYRRVFPWVPTAVTVPTDEDNATRHVLAHALTRRLRATPGAAETATAVSVLRLLLDDPHVDPDDLDWAAIGDVAERDGVIVRLADVVARRGEPLPPRFAAAAVRGRARTERVLLLVDRLGAVCRRHGIEHAFLKVVERHPDAGRDLDLLIDAPTVAVDRLLLADLPARARPRRWRHRLTGATTHTVDHDLVLDIHHGRLGQLGEHDAFARTLLARARDVRLAGITCRSPLPEHHLLVQVLHQTYARPALRIADLLWTITALREPALDRMLLATTADALDVRPAVNAYLDYVRHVERLLQAGSHLPAHPPGFRFPPPASRLPGRLFLQQVCAALASGAWSRAARLVTLPAVAVAAGLSRRR